jgi:hypothetical protein
LFEVRVAPMETVCQEIEAGRDVPRDPGAHVLFEDPFSPAQIIQLGEVITHLTGVPADFGSDTNRREPVGCVFVDRLDAAWVSAASLVQPSMAREICARWVAACTDAERERPTWGDTVQTETVLRFLELCRKATATNTDLVMVWEL